MEDEIRNELVVPETEEKKSEQSKKDKTKQSSNSKDNSESKKKQTTLSILEELNKSLIEISKQYGKLATRIQKKDLRITELKKTISLQEADLIEESNNAEELRAKIQSLNGELSRAESKINLLNNSINEKDIEIDNLKTEIIHKNNEINAKEELLEIVNKDGASTVSELKQKIASQLSLDYQDFLDSKELEMNVPLGENLRVQLDNIFKQLKQLGIPVGE